MAEQLERMGARLTNISPRRSKTEEDMDAELTAAAGEGVKIQLLLDTIADAEKITGHRQRSATRSCTGPSAPDVRRSSTTTRWSSRGGGRRLRRRAPGKALAQVMERVMITDTAGRW